jgi:hypothetical protein
MVGDENRYPDGVAQICRFLDREVAGYSVLSPLFVATIHWQQSDIRFVRPQDFYQSVERNAVAGVINENTGALEDETEESEVTITVSFQRFVRCGDGSESKVRNGSELFAGVREMHTVTWHATFECAGTFGSRHNEDWRGAGLCDGSDCPRVHVICVSMCADERMHPRQSTRLEWCRMQALVVEFSASILVPQGVTQVWIYNPAYTGGLEEKTGLPEPPQPDAIRRRPELLEIQWYFARPHIEGMELNLTHTLTPLFEVVQQVLYRCRGNSIGAF